MGGLTRWCSRKCRPWISRGTPGSLTTGAKGEALTAISSFSCRAKSSVVWLRVSAGNSIGSLPPTFTLAPAGAGLETVWAKSGSSRSTRSTQTFSGRGWSYCLNWIDVPVMAGMDSTFTGLGKGASCPAKRNPSNKQANIDRHP